jgi:hypothetical protein
MNMRAVLIGCTGLFLLALLPTLGCVERTITVESDPPGALVYLNEEEIGRTPVQRDFLWYGTYSVAVRKPGYESIKTKADVPPPFYQWPPFDLIAELLPIQITDSHSLNYTLQLQPAGEGNEGLLDRALAARAQLESSHLPPTTRATKSTTRQSSTRPVNSNPVNSK